MHFARCPSKDFSKEFYMAKWPHSVVSAIGRWRLEWRTTRESVIIAREIYPTLWENVRRKLATTSDNDLTVYAKVRAAQLSQERVDSRMQANPALSGAYATQLLLKATDRATDLVVAAVASARRSAA
jgi:hypothetical protein